MPDVWAIEECMHYRVDELSICCGWVKPAAIDRYNYG